MYEIFSQYFELYRLTLYNAEDYRVKTNFWYSTYQYNHILFCIETIITGYFLFGTQTKKCQNRQVKSDKKLVHINLINNPKTSLGFSGHYH